MILDLALAITVFLLLGASAFFSGSETALFALDSRQRQRLRKRQDLPARCVASLLNRLPETLATILVGNTLVNILIAVLATRILIGHLGAQRGAVASTVIVTLVVLIFGEIFPKSLAVLGPQNFSLRIGRPLVAVRRVLGPLARVLEWMSHGIRSMFSHLVPPDLQAMNEEDVVALVSVAVEEGDLGEKELELVRGVFELAATPVEETMTPRVDCYLLDGDTPIRQALPLLRAVGFSRVPLFQEKQDRVVGMLWASDLLNREDSEDPVSSLARPARFCPESQMAGPLLKEMLAEDENLAVVADEYGSLAGLVSVVDLYEVLVGDIFTRRDLESQRFYLPDENTLIASARLELEQLTELMKVELDESHDETLGGYLMEALGEVPATGQSVSLNGLTWTVIDAEGPALKTLRLERKR